VVEVLERGRSVSREAVEMRISIQRTRYGGSSMRTAKDRFDEAADVCRG
jgi:hypothetical protein